MGGRRGGEHVERDRPIEQRTRLVPAAGVLRNYVSGHIEEGRTGWVGLFANPNDLAYSLVILIPIAACLAVRSRWPARLVLLGIMLFFAAGIFVTFSRGGLIGFGAVVCFYAWRQRNVVTWIVLMLISMIGVMVVQDPVLSLIGLVVVPPAMLMLRKLVKRIKGLAYNQFTGTADIL